MLKANGTGSKLLYR